MSDSSNNDETPNAPTNELRAAPIPPAEAQVSSPVVETRASRSERLRERLAGTSRSTRIIGAAVAAVVLILAVGSAGYAIGNGGGDNGNGNGGSHAGRHDRDGSGDRDGRHGNGNRDRDNNDSQNDTSGTTDES
ncbi:MAG: hypothetical protein JWR55_983 [Aeromicrobium sp.]|nr:hypothetical protein [Aeromicrobium sp.]